MTSLYRRYRSARLADLVGQEHIARTLGNELRNDGLAHAYLFAGIRGTGKTSTARILARAVNCREPAAGEPCNVCTACVEIHSGAAVDVLEIDAASNRGVDEMRDLRDKVKYLPASLRRKVYIIDEAHMLTTDAWNAFLKTLEEPPDHVLFILCTTEAHKVPETVRSRVQRFDFRRVATTEIAGHLRRIATSEAVELEPEVVDLIARAAQGSVRDALSLLDQVLGTGERPVSATTCRRALGLADPATIRELLVALGGRDAAGALRAAAAAFDAGVDPRQLLRECARLARAAELCAVGYPEGAALAEGEADFCQRLAAVASTGFWLTVLEQASAAELELRQPVDARLQVEACLLRLCRRDASQEPAGTRISRLEERMEVVVRRLGAAAGPASPARAGEPVPGELRPAAVRGAPTAAFTTPPSPPAGAPSSTSAAVAAAQASPPAGAIPNGGGGSELPAAASPDDAGGAGPDPLTSVEGWRQAWTLLQEAVNRRDRVFAGVLRSCRPLKADAESLVIGAPYKFHLDRIRDPGKSAILADAVAAVAGGPRRITTEFCGEPVPPADLAGAGPDATQAVLSTFAGSRVTSTRLHDRHRDGGSGGPADPQPG